MTFYLLIPFLFILIAFIIKLPIAWGMFIGSTIYLLLRGMSPLTIINAAANGIYGSYILIAIPLFIFTANIMNSSKVTDNIFSFANVLLGKFRGGTAYVNIFASLIFAGMTGSALADASGLGIIEINQMKKEGYDLPFSCAITATTSVIGPIFPPSIPFVIFAMISGASVGKMFIGGIIPAILLCIMLGIYVYIISKKRNYPIGRQYNLKELSEILFNALPALITPVIILLGIYTGIMTPTEAGAVAALYTLIISILFYRTLTPEKFKNVLINTIKTTGSIFFIVAAAYSFSYIITLEQIAPCMEKIITNVHLNKYTFLFITNIIFIILGCFIDVNVTQLVFVPIFVPIAKELGLDMVHFGVMLCLNMMIGLATPPFGMLLFITSGIAKCPLKDIIREVMPMLIFMFITLFLVTYLPQIVLFLPSIMQ